MSPEMKHCSSSRQNLHSFFISNPSLFINFALFFNPSLWYIYGLLRAILFFFRFSIVHFSLLINILYIIRVLLCFTNYFCFLFLYFFSLRSLLLALCHIFFSFTFTNCQIMIIVVLHNHISIIITIIKLLYPMIMITTSPELLNR